MAEGDPGLISEMIEIFSTQVSEFRKLMQELSKLAHKAKSSVAIMGMTELADQLRELEMLAREEKQTESYPGYIKFFTTASKDAVTELNNYLANR